MKYQPPYGVADLNAGYVNGDPSVGRAGSIPPGEAIEHPQREIVNLILDAGRVAPDRADLHQLAKSVQSTLLYSDDDAGTANQYQVTQTPAPTDYFKYMTVVTRIGNTNTGPSTLNVNAMGAKPIARIDGTPLNPGDLVQGTIVCLIYDGSQFQLVWANAAKGGSQNVLTQSTTIYVNGTTGSDTLYDGTSATVVAGTTKGPFKTIQKGVDTAFKFLPSAQYAMTVQVADGTYLESVRTPTIPGPNLIINGNAASPGNVIIDSTSKGSTIVVSGPNVVTVQNLRFQMPNSIASAGASATGAGASLTCLNTISGPCAGWCFLANGLGGVTIGNHTFLANVGYAFAAYRNGAINLGGGAVYQIGAAMSVSAFAMAVSGGQIEVPATGVPTFSGAGNVSGPKYNAYLNGVINTQAAGGNYFPGSSAGSLASGGQYG